jgi:hypothetical protein
MRALQGRSCARSNPQVVEKELSVSGLAGRCTTDRSGALGTERKAPGTGAWLSGRALA